MWRLIYDGNASLIKYSKLRVYLLAFEHILQSSSSYVNFSGVVIRAEFELVMTPKQVWLLKRTVEYDYNLWKKLVSECMLHAHDVGGTGRTVKPPVILT